MKLIIDIPDEDYEHLKLFHEGVTDYQTTLKLYRAVKNGTVLPKGHGRLIDVDQIVYERECVGETDGCWTTRSTPDIDATPTIIASDKEEENESEKER